MNQCGCAFGNNPRQTQTVQLSSFDVFLLKVLWSNKIGKSDLRRTYGRLRMSTVSSALCRCKVLHSSHLSPRSVKRFSRRVFGFMPILLLRRQRFLRSLSQFMLDPSMRWIKTLDSQYFDQAHFARDFNRFMGMSARPYAGLDYPILGAAAFARMASAGASMQVLHLQTD